MGSQSGSVMSVTSTSPGCTSSIWLMEEMTGPGCTDLVADGAPDQHLAGLL